MPLRTLAILNLICWLVRIVKSLNSLMNDWLITLVKLINQSFNSEFKDFTIRTNQRKQLIVLDTKLSLARVRNS